MHSGKYQTESDAILKKDIESSGRIAEKKGKFVNRLDFREFVLF